MKTQTGMTVAVVLLMISAVWIMYDNQSDNRPTIRLEIIKTTPKIYIENHTNIMLPAESVLLRAYRLKKNVKWLTEYKYAYVILKPNRLFFKEKYLKFHAEDGVDYKVIFSNRIPDPQLFIIQQ